MSGIARVLAALLALAGCGKQLRRAEPEVDALMATRDALAQPAWEDLRLRHARVATLEHRLRLVAADACPSPAAPLLGVVALGRKDVRGKNLRGVVEELFDLGAHPTVLHVVPGSAADAAGIRRGDQIATLDGRPLEVERELREALLAARGAFELGVVRAEGALQVSIDAPLACRIDVGLSEHDVVAVYEDLFGERGRPFVTAGLVRFVESDDELLVAIAQALSLAIHHEQREDADDAAARAAVERSTTRVALRLAAGAGADVSVAAGFWERVAVEDPGQIIERRDRDTVHQQTDYPLALRVVESRAAASELARAPAR